MAQGFKQFKIILKILLADYKVSIKSLLQNICLGVLWCKCCHWDVILAFLILQSIDVFLSHTTQSMKFSIKDFFSNWDQIWSHLLKKSLMVNFNVFAVSARTYAQKLFKSCTFATHFFFVVFQFHIFQETV